MTAGHVHREPTTRRVPGSISVALLCYILCVKSTWHASIQECFRSLYCKFRPTVALLFPSRSPRAALVDIQVPDSVFLRVGGAGEEGCERKEQGGNAGSLGRGD